MRLDTFLTANRAEIIDRCRAKVRTRRVPQPTDGELERGIPLFLDQLIDTLHRHQVKNPDGAGIATAHGGELMSQGFTVAQLVHDYGDVCQSVTELAIEREASISAEDFHTFNRCLDDAIADAVTEFSRLRDLRFSTEGTERLGILAHELRNLLATASLSFEVLQSGRVGITGATAELHQRTLLRLGTVIDRSLAQVRLEVGNFHRGRLDVRQLLEEIEVAASLLAKPKGIALAVGLPTDAGIAVEGDAQILSAVLVNLVQNAIKFTRPEGHVTLSARATAERVQIDVADECGGLPPGTAEALFQPFEQRGADRSGVGLGLVIARRGAEAHGGEVHVRDVPGTGCVFTLELPRAL